MISDHSVDMTCREIAEQGSSAKSSSEEAAGLKNNRELSSEDSPASVKYSYIHPTWRFVLLWLSTLGYYQIYWFYRNWKQLKEHRNLDWSPLWRTFFLFVPLANVIVILQAFQDISYFARDAGVVKNYSPSVIFFSFLILNVFNFLPEYYQWLSWIGLLAVVPLAVVQNTLNAFWKIEQPLRPVRNKFSHVEILVLAIGGIFWAGLILGIFANHLGY